MRGSGDKQYQAVKASRDGLRLFRCRSGSRPLQTWALSSVSSVLVYLAAESEEETQSWMQDVRDGLWPPIFTNLGGTHDVSLIDDERSFTSGIHGLYGRLVLMPDGMMSIIHPHWQGTLLRWKKEDVIEVGLIRKVGGKTSEAGVFQITLRWVKKGQTLNFYSKTAKSVIQWIQSCSAEQKNFEMNRNMQNTSESKKPFVDKNGISEEIKTEYATVRKLSKQLVADQTEKTNVVSAKNEDQTLPSNNHLTLPNISSELLNASISSVISPQKDSIEENVDTIQTKEDGNDSDESLSDLYSHVYEEMAPRAASVGAYTLYEEIDDGDESEYVLPLPPPLPNRPIEKPNSLRLLKLSESVIEALKIAEKSPNVIEEQRKNLLQKVSKTSKSLQASPMNETPTSTKQWDDISSLQRRSSESDISNHKTDEITRDKKMAKIRQDSKNSSPGQTVSRAIPKLNGRGSVEGTEIS